MCVRVCLSISLSLALSLSVSHYLSNYLSVYLVLCLSLCVSVYIHLSIYLSICLSVCLLIFPKGRIFARLLTAKLTGPKRSNPARRPQEVDSSKMKKPRQTPSKDESSRLQKTKFCVTSSSREVDISFAPHLPRDMHLWYLCRSPSNFPRLPSATEPFRFPTFLAGCRIHCPCHATLHPNFKTCSETVSVQHFWRANVLRATCRLHFFDSSQVLRWCTFNVLTPKSSLRHTRVQFLNISISKRAPRLMCFDHFYFQICFAPKCNSWFLIWPDGSAPAALESLVFTNHWRNTIICDFSFFPRTLIFFLVSPRWPLLFRLFLFFPPLLFHIPTLLEV